MTCCGIFKGTKHFRVPSRLLLLWHQSSWMSVQQLLARSPLASYSFSVQVTAGCSTMSSANERSGVPTVTAIAVSKKCLPSFPQVRPTCRSDKVDRTTEPYMLAQPSSDVVESALRSALGIGHDASSEYTEAAKPSTEASVSTDDPDDPAIVSWSLAQAETTADQTDRLVTTSNCDDPAGKDLTVAAKLDRRDAVVVTHGDDVSTKMPRKRRQRKKLSMVAEDRSQLMEGGAQDRERSDSSDHDCTWISELPGATSCTTDDESDDSVYSLKSLFAGSFGSASVSPSKKLKTKLHNADSFKKRPNYFVAVQVDSTDVHAEARRLQEHMYSQEPEIAAALIAIPTLHITILVLRIDDDDSLQRAKEALSRTYKRVKDELEKTPITMRFQGLDHFRKEVLYAKMSGEEDCARLGAVGKVCLEEFTKAELDLSGHKQFKGHLTLVKLSRTDARKTGLKKIREEWYSDFIDTHFGSQRVNSLQLLSMSKPKDERGYYYSSHVCTFAGSTKEANADHSECCRPVVEKTSRSKTSPLTEEQVLKLSSAKEKIKSKISTLTKAKLAEMDVVPTGKSES